MLSLINCLKFLFIKDNERQFYEKLHNMRREWLILFHLLQRTTRDVSRRLVSGGTKVIFILWSLFMSFLTLFNIKYHNNRLLSCTKHLRFTVDLKVTCWLTYSHHEESSYPIKLPPPTFGGQSKTHQTNYKRDLKTLVGE